MSTRGLRRVMAVAGAAMAVAQVVVVVPRAPRAVATTAPLDTWEVLTNPETGLPWTDVTLRGVSARVAGDGSVRVWAVGDCHRTGTDPSDRRNPCRDDAVVLGSSDGGDSWSPQASWTTALVPAGETSQAVLHDVEFADENHGYAVGAVAPHGFLRYNQSVLATSDGGATWRRVYTSLALPNGHGADTRELFRISCTDAARCHAVGGNRGIVATSDAGATWRVQQTGGSTTDDGQGLPDTGTGNVPALIDLWGVSFTDGPGCATQGTTAGDLDFTRGCYGWAVDERGAIVATTDGGATWRAQVPSTSMVGSGNLYGVWFTDHLHGWAVGSLGKILATTDGGRTWVAQDSGTATDNDGFSAVAFANRSRGWAVSCSQLNEPGRCDPGPGPIITTADGGRTWARMAHPLADQPQRRHLLDLAVAPDPARGVVHVFAVGEGGTIMRLTTSISPVTGRIKSVSCTDADRCHAVGDFPGALATTDGGRSWNVQPLDAPGAAGNQANAVSFTDGPGCPPEYPAGCHGHAVANATAGTHVTADGGNTWRLQPGGISRATLGSVAFADFRNGHAVDVESSSPPAGWVFSTSDGGETWSQTFYTAAQEIVAVATADADHALALAAGSGPNFVVRTADGGETWDPGGTGPDAPEGAPPGTLVFSRADTTRLWDLSVADGPGCRALADEAWRAGCYAWAVGNKGQIFRSADGGTTWARQLKPNGQPWTDLDLFAVSFADPSVGVAVGAGPLAPGAGRGPNDHVLVTTDGGRTWQRRPLEVEGPNGGFLDVSATRDRATGVVTAVAVGVGGAIRRFEIPPPEPTLTGLTPTSGADGGGDEVTLTGTGFTPDTTVAFGAAPPVRPAAVTSTSLTVVTPAHQPGTVDVAVRTFGGRYSAVLPQAFTYLPESPGPPDPPATPTLTAVATSPTEVTLRFPAVASAGPGSAPATEYVIKRSSEPITSHAAFAAADPVCPGAGGACGFPVAEVGTEITHVAAGLAPETTYHFAVRAAGPAGLGPLSNSASATTGCGPVPAAGPGRVARPAGYHLVGFPTGTVVPVRRLYGWFDQGAGGAYAVLPPTGTEAGRGYWAWFRCPRLIELPAAGAAATPLQMPLGAFRASIVGNPSATRQVTVSGFDFAARYVPGPDGRPGDYAISGYREPQPLAVGEAIWVFSFEATTIRVE